MILKQLTVLVLVTTLLIDENLSAPQQYKKEKQLQQTSRSAPNVRGRQQTNVASSGNNGRQLNQRSASSRGRQSIKGSLKQTPQHNQGPVNQGRQLTRDGPQNYGVQQNPEHGQPKRGRQLQPSGQGQQPPMDYNFEWSVDAQEYDNYYGHREEAKSGRVQGSYYVFLPDQRLMRVDYYVDGESGFVPTITYEDSYSPKWGSKPY